MIFNTVAKMKLAKLTAGQIISTKGYSVAGDGGGASYLVAASQTVDGHSDHALANGTVALLQSSGAVNAARYGVDFTDTADSLSSLTATFGESSLLPKGTTKVVGQATPTTGTSISGIEGSKIRFDSATTASKVDFVVSNSNTSFKDFYVEHDGVASETAQVFQLGASCHIWWRCPHLSSFVALPRGGAA